MTEKEALLISDRFRGAGDRLKAAQFLFQTWEMTGEVTSTVHSILEDAVEEYQQALFAYAQHLHALNVKPDATE